MSDGFRINKAYADRYNQWRHKEELQKLKDRYGDDVDDTDTDSESEDENAEALTSQVEKDWLRTLAALKSKDPKIYQKGVTFYHQNEDLSSGSEENPKKKKKKAKPVYLKDLERKKILEDGGKMSDDSDDSGDENPVPAAEKFSYYQQQEELKKNITAAVSSGDDSDEGEFLMKKRKTNEEKLKEEEDFRQWLKGRKEKPDEEQVGVELAPLKNYWDKPDLHSDEKFLRDYILNERYKEPDEDKIPSYDEIVEEFSEEEELLVRQETFERKYNFRFEEPEGLELKTYPRSLENTLRKKDTKRADKRKEIKERKKMEKEKKKEELKQLKNLKKQEIFSKIEKLKMITGNETLAFTEDELNEDFDPQKYDEMMKRCFDEDYYDEGQEEETKPVYNLSDDDVQPESWDTWDGTDLRSEEDPQGDVYWDTGKDRESVPGPSGQYEPHVDDPDFNMDADYDPTQPQVQKKKKKKKGMKGKLAEALSKEKPVFDPDEKSFEQYLDEYYKLDYEDIIDDLPCRFKYRKTVANSFGLTPDEILTAEERDLNSWVSLKKMSQYRTEEEEKSDLHIYSRKARDEKKKRRLLPSLFQKEDDLTEETNKNQIKKKTEIPSQTLTPSQEEDEAVVNLLTPKASTSSDTLSDTALSATNACTDSDVLSRKKKKKRKHEDTNDIDKSSSHNIKSKKVSSEPDEKSADGSASSPKQKKKAHVKGQLNSVSEVVSKKKKKNKKIKVDKGSKSVKITNSDKESNETKKQQKKKKKTDDKLFLSAERLKAYGINPNKYKYLKKEDLHFKHKDS